MENVLWIVLLHHNLLWNFDVNLLLIEILLAFPFAWLYSLYDSCLLFLYFSIRLYSFVWECLYNRNTIFWHSWFTLASKHLSCAQSVLTAYSMCPKCLRFVLAVCRGILIKTLANASQDRKPMPVSQMVINVVGFCITVSATVTVTWYAKMRLKELQMQEELLL